jgi:hypothetical protein
MAARLRASFDTGAVAAAGGAGSGAAGGGVGGVEGAAAWGRRGASAGGARAAAGRPLLLLPLLPPLLPS